MVASSASLSSEELTHHLFLMATYPVMDGTRTSILTLTRSEPLWSTHGFVGASEIVRLERARYVTIQIVSKEHPDAETRASYREIIDNCDAARKKKNQDMFVGTRTDMLAVVAVRCCWVDLWSWSCPGADRNRRLLVEALW